MVNAAIVGATGYAGEELIHILLKHPFVRITNLSAKIDAPAQVSELFPRFKKRIDLVCYPLDIKKVIMEADLVFLALPHTVSMSIVPKLLSAGKKVIDLSADYRLKDPKVYGQYYQTAHTDIPNLKPAVYGLPELYRQKIKGASLIANPGCYPTAAVLAVAPLLATAEIEPHSIIIDAKSGVTGAGRKVANDFLFPEVNEDFRAYKVNSHQHAPEINQDLSKLASLKIKTTFVPHLLPLNRGILETIYLKSLKPKASTRDIIALYRKFYKNEPFIRIKEEGSFPRLKDVCGTNYCDIAVKADGSTIIVIAAIDNLLKGASGQAVQNTNIMYKFPETTALV